MGAGECDLRMAWRADDMGQYSGFLHACLIAAVLDTACGFAANTTASGVLSSHQTDRWAATTRRRRQRIAAAGWGKPGPVLARTLRTSSGWAHSLHTTTACMSWPHSV